MITEVKSLGLLPYSRTEWWNCTPFFSFRLSMSHLFRKQINVVFWRSFDETIAFHSPMESLRRFTEESSRRASSKHDTAIMLSREVTRGNIKVDLDDLRATIAKGEPGNPLSRRRSMTMAMLLTKYDSRDICKQARMRPKVKRCSGSLPSKKGIQARRCEQFKKN